MTRRGDHSGVRLWIVATLLLATKVDDDEEEVETIGAISRSEEVVGAGERCCPLPDFGELLLPGAREEDDNDFFVGASASDCGDGDRTSLGYNAPRRGEGGGKERR